jgi:hypothetical protein
MAVPDHTVLDRLSGLPDYLFAHLRGVSPDSCDMGEPSPPANNHLVACIDQVKFVISSLLGDSDAFREATNEGLDVWPHQWPLTPMAYGGLLVASQLLDQYAVWLTSVSNE